MSWTGQHLPRPRLSGSAVAQPATVVEAPGGYGKSAWAHEVARELGVGAVSVALMPTDATAEAFLTRLAQALKRAGHTDLGAVLESRESSAHGVASLLGALDGSAQVLFVVDDAHCLRDAEAGELLATFATQMVEPHRVLVLCRELPAGARKLVMRAGVRAIGAADLAFTDDEVAQLVGPAEAAAVVESTGGWPAAVVMLATRLARGESIASSSGSIAALVALALDDLGADDTAAMLQVARGPWFTESLLDTLSGNEGSVGRISRAGIVLRSTGRGVYELAGPVAEHLASLAEPDQAMVRVIAEHYVAAGDVAAALFLLRSTGDVDAAAGVLAAIPHDGIIGVEQRDITAFLETLPAPVAAAHPKALLHLVRSYIRDGSLRNRSRAIERARQALAGTDDVATLHLVEVEALRLMLDKERLDEAAPQIDDLLSVLTADEREARMWLLSLRARLEVRHQDFELAESLYREALALARGFNARAWVANFLLQLGNRVYLRWGKNDRAIDTLQEAVAVADGPIQRALMLAFLGDVLADVGRFAEATATIEELLEIGERVRDQTSIDLAWWGLGRVASMSGDRVKTVASLARVDASTAAWRQSPLNVEFLTDAAELLDRVGEHEEARRWLARVPVDTTVANRALSEAILEARSGDAARATELLDAVGDVDPRDAWRHTLFRAWCAHRLGATESAERLAARAFDEAAALGADAAYARERVVAESLVGLAARGGSASAQQLAGGVMPVTIAMLGGFTVLRGGAALALAGGKSTQAMKVVCCAGGRVTTDALIDALWPEADADTGRRRLRNVLARAQAGEGDLLVRDGDAVALAAHVEVDALTFETEARAALDASGLDRTIRARSALSRAVGDLLPDDLYEPWAAAPRERVRRRRLELVDLLAADATDRGEIDEALRLAEDGIELDPYEEARYVRAARMLRAVGRTTAARSVAQRGRARLEDLALAPSPALLSFVD